MAMSEEFRLSNEELVRMIQSGSNDLLAELYERNHGLIWKTCFKYSGACREMDDLMMEAYLAMRDAALTFDFTKGVLFSSYMVRRLEWRIIRYLGDSAMIRVPETLRNTVKKRAKVTGALSVCGIRASDTLLDVLTGDKKPTRINQAVAAGTPILSLSQPLGGDCEDLTLESSIADPVDYMQEVEDRADRERMNKEFWFFIFNQLPTEEREIICKHYRHGISLKDCGECAYQLHAKALRKLKRPKCKAKLNCFYEWIYGESIRHNGSREYQRTWTSSVEKIVLRIMER